MCLAKTDKAERCKRCNYHQGYSLPAGKGALVFTHCLPTTETVTFVLANRYDFGMTSHDVISIFSQLAADSLYTLCVKLRIRVWGRMERSVGGSCGTILTV